MRPQCELAPFISVCPNTISSPPRRARYDTRPASCLGSCCSVLPRFSSSSVYFRTAQAPLRDPLMYALTSCFGRCFSTNCTLVQAGLYRSLTSDSSRPSEFSATSSTLKHSTSGISSWSPSSALLGSSCSSSRWWPFGGGRFLWPGRRM